MTVNVGNTRRNFYSNRFAKKQEELAAIDAQLGGTISKEDEVKLNRKAETLLEEIEKIEATLKELDAKNEDSNIRYLSLEKSFQKIDFSQAKNIACKINNKLGDRSGAIIVFLQKTTKQNGHHCINEFIDLIISDRKLGDQINGDYRPFPIDLGSSISGFDENEFSQRLASYLNKDTQEPLKYSIQKLCESLQGGSTVFIRIENWDTMNEPEAFLDWFMTNFWQNVIDKLNIVFQKYSKIRFVVALIAKSQVFSDCCSLEYFSSKDTIDHRKIIEIPLPNWTVKDIQDWLIINLRYSDLRSLTEAKQIYRESEGTPHTICAILEKLIDKENTIRVC